MAALGPDIGGLNDIDPFLTLASPAQSVALAVLSSFSIEPGTLFWAPERGVNLIGFLHTSDPDLERLERALQTEAEADERVESAAVSTTLLGNDLQVGVELTLTQDETRVRLTLTVDLLSGEVLDANIN